MGKLQVSYQATDSRVLELMRSSMAANTVRVYENRLGVLSAWLKSKGIDSLTEILPSHLTLFLATVGKDRSASWRTQLVAAVNAVYRSVKMDSPAKDPEVNAVLSGLRRTQNTKPKQALPLLEKHMDQVNKVAGLMEKALINVMRDGMLRVGEAANLNWDHVTLLEDDTGRIVIERSKTDQDGKGHVCYLRKRTVAALRRYGIGISGLVFPFRPETLTRKIAETCRMAGLGDGYTGHSCRVGMTCDLVDRGASLLSVQVAGRWKSADMPAYYARQMIAGQNAIATFMEN